MDSSLQSANMTADELSTSLATDHETVGSAGSGEGEEHHVHLPNPSLWPMLLSVAILVTMAGLIFIPANPWISIVGAPFVLIGILGWALEDPMAPLKEKFATLYNVAYNPSKYKIGQEVIDKEGESLGKVQARFPNYILVERSGVFPKAYYVPQSAIRGTVKNDILFLSLSEQELRDRGLNSVPDDLYDESPEFGVPDISGVAQFARGPLSPAQTGHYNYGPNYPGINTDASGSYHHEEVVPRPQRYVGERRKIYATSWPIPPRDVSPD